MFIALFTISVIVILHFNGSLQHFGVPMLREVYPTFDKSSAGTFTWNKFTIMFEQSLNRDVAPHPGGESEANEMQRKRQKCRIRRGKGSVLLFALR